MRAAAWLASALIIGLGQPGRGDEIDSLEMLRALCADPGEGARMCEGIFITFHRVAAFACQDARLHNEAATYPALDLMNVSPRDFRDRFIELASTRAFQEEYGDQPWGISMFNATRHVWPCD